MQTERLLLDTHVFLWWRAADPRLGEPARALTLVDVSAVVHVAHRSRFRMTDADFDGLPDVRYFPKAA